MADYDIKFVPFFPYLLFKHLVSIGSYKRILFHYPHKKEGWHCFVATNGHILTIISYRMNGSKLVKDFDLYNSFDTGHAINFDESHFNNLYKDTKELYPVYDGNVRLYNIDYVEYKVGNNLVELPSTEVTFDWKKALKRGDHNDQPKANIILNVNDFAKITKMHSLLSNRLKTCSYRVSKHADKIEWVRFTNTEDDKGQESKVVKFSTTGIYEPTVNKQEDDALQVEAYTIFMGGRERK